MKSKTIPAKAKKDAMAVCSSIYRMNEPHAVGYAFNFNEKEVTTGEFISCFELKRAKSEYEAFYDFKTHKFTLNA